MGVSVPGCGELEWDEREPRRVSVFCNGKLMCVIDHGIYVSMAAPETWQEQMLQIQHKTGLIGKSEDELRKIEANFYSMIRGG